MPLPVKNIHITAATEVISFLQNFFSLKFRWCFISCSEHQLFMIFKIFYIFFFATVILCCCKHEHIVRKQFSLEDFHKVGTL